MRSNTVSLLSLVVFALAGCSTSQQVNPHTLKLDLPYTKTIAGPHEWALIQFSDGPVSGPEVSDYAKLVLKDGLCQAFSEPGPDGTRDLFIRRDCHASCWQVVAFTQVEGGYRYLGSFPVSIWMVSLAGRTHSVLVYVPCDGHQGSIEVYEHDGNRFCCESSEGIACGDGAPQDNNRRLRTLFPRQRLVKWMKMRDQ